ncbi:MAG: ferredoxin [Chthoniobacteraceae bacterium]|nr:ferredoxin [Chthoniobacteraceae bacterium]
MADYCSKVPENVPGPWYVDATCTPCRTCLDVDGADSLIKWNDDETYVYFHEQPIGDAQVAIAEEIMAVCPTAAVGSDGE